MRLKKKTKKKNSQSRSLLHPNRRFLNTRFIQINEREGKRRKRIDRKIEKKYW